MSGSPFWTRERNTARYAIAALLYRDILYYVRYLLLRAFYYHGVSCNSVPVPMHLRLEVLFIALAVPWYPTYLFDICFNIFL